MNSGDVEWTPPDFGPPETAEPAAAAQIVAAPSPDPVEDPLAAPPLFRTPPFAPTPSGPGRPAMRAMTAALGLMVLAAALAVVFRDPIVRLYPALSPAYRAVGLPPAPQPRAPNA